MSGSCVRNCAALGGRAGLCLCAPEGPAVHHRPLRCLPSTRPTSFTFGRLHINLPTPASHALYQFSFPSVAKGSSFLSLAFNLIFSTCCPVVLGARRPRYYYSLCPASVSRLLACGSQNELVLTGEPHPANAACECGYSVNSTSDSSYAVFTELMENDFLHTSTDDLKEVGWQPQEYNVTSQNARGPFGKSMELTNIVTNPFKNKKGWSGDAEHGGDAGLELWVRGDHQDGLVSGAELVTMRNDSLLGSFRVGMKLSNSSGTCGAFFFVWSHTLFTSLKRD